MEPNKALLNHPFWRATDPNELRLVRTSRPLPRELNPFEDDRVEICAAGVPGEAPHSKWIMARAGILRGVESGAIQPDTTIVEATSGNTGQGMAAVCTALELGFVPVMSGDVPQSKIEAIRVVGRGVKPQLLFDDEVTTVEHARELGRQPGWYNPDQYGGSWNPEAHQMFLGRQLMSHWRGVHFVPAGTMGTSLGLANYAMTARPQSVVVPVVCAPNEEVPGARTLASIKKDVRQPWQDVFRESDIESGTRHAAFLLSFLSWKYVPQMLGPSFGLAYAGALRFLKKHKEAGTLEVLRDRESGFVHVVVFGPDDYRPYMSLYLGELKKKELSSKTPPTDLLALVA